MALYTHKSINVFTIFIFKQQLVNFFYEIILQSYNNVQSYKPIFKRYNSAGLILFFIWWSHIYISGRKKIYSFNIVVQIHLLKRGARLTVFSWMEEQIQLLSFNKYKWGQSLQGFLLHFDVIFLKKVMWFFFKNLIISLECSYQTYCNIYNCMEGTYLIKVNELAWVLLHANTISSPIIAPFIFPPSRLFKVVWWNVHLEKQWTGFLAAQNFLREEVHIPSARSPKI